MVSRPFAIFGLESEYGHLKAVDVRGLANHTLDTLWVDGCGIHDHGCGVRTDESDHGPPKRIRKVNNFYYIYILYIYTRVSLYPHWKFLKEMGTRVPCYEAVIYTVYIYTYAINGRSSERTPNRPPVTDQSSVVGSSR